MTDENTESQEYITELQTINARLALLSKKLKDTYASLCPEYSELNKKKDKFIKEFTILNNTDRELLNLKNDLLTESMNISIRIRKQTQGAEDELSKNEFELEKNQLDRDEIKIRLDFVRRMRANITCQMKLCALELKVDENTEKLENEFHELLQKAKKL